MKDTIVCGDYQLVIQLNFQAVDDVAARRHATSIYASIIDAMVASRRFENDTTLKMTNKFQRVFKNKPPEGMLL